MSPSVGPRRLQCVCACVFTRTRLAAYGVSVGGPGADAAGRRPRAHVWISEQVTRSVPSSCVSGCLLRQGGVVHGRASWATVGGQRRAGAKEDPAATLPTASTRPGGARGVGSPRVDTLGTVALPSRSPSGTLRGELPRGSSKRCHPGVPSGCL